MGLEDLIKKKASQNKVRKTVLTVTDISKVASESEKNRNEEINARPNVSEKVSWFSKKDDAEWVSGPSDDDDDDQIIIEAIKKEEHIVENLSKISTTPPETTPVWGAVKTQEESAQPAPEASVTYVPNAFKHQGLMKPKVQDVMEFPTLETAAKEENVKVKPEPENQNAWKTVSARNETDSYQSGGYRPRVYDDKGSFNRRRRDQPEPEGDWTRGKTIQSSQPLRREAPVDLLDASGFVRGGPMKSTQDRGARFSERTFSPRIPRSNAPDDSNDWTRGNVIQSQASDGIQRNDDLIDMRQEAKANEYSMRHKNRFEALSELN